MRTNNRPTILVGAVLCLGFSLSALTTTASAQVVADDVQCNGCVGKTDIGSRQVTSKEIRRGGVTTPNLKRGAVTENKLADGAVTHAKLAPDVIFERTRFVMLSGNGEDSTANGFELLDALDEVAGSSPPPSAENPWRVKLDRGVYDVGTTPLDMVPFVAIEGAGRNATTILGDVDDSSEGVINGASDSALRHITVENLGNLANVAIVISVGVDGFSLHDVAVKIDSATANQAFGIIVDGGAVSLTNVSVQAQAANGQSQGIRGQSNAELHMVGTWVHNQSGAFGNPAALELRDSSATGFGVLFSSNFFGLLGRGAAFFELFDGTVIGGRGTGSTFSGAFTCIAIADANFTARNADCT